MTSLNIKILATLFVGALAGCGGGGSNNDAGQGVTLTGFNAAPNGICSASQKVTSILMPISGGAEAENPTGEGSVGAFSCFEAQNNLVTQAVRVDRALIRYFVAGASAQPPSTVTAAAAYLAAAQGNTSLPGGGIVTVGGNQPGVQPGSKPQGTLPSGASGGAPRITAGFNVVPSAVSEWISANRSLLPPPPFQMIASVQLSAVTSAGDRIETNELPLNIIVSEDNIF